MNKVYINNPSGYYTLCKLSNRYIDKNIFLDCIRKKAKERDYNIIVAKLELKSYRKIGQLFDLSAERVRQIVTKLVRISLSECKIIDEH